MKNNLQAGNLPTWALILLIILFILGLLASIWGIASAFGLNKNKINSDDKVFKGKEIINFKSGFKNNHGIFALTFLNYDKNDFFIPIFIFETKDFLMTRDAILKEIEMEEKQIIFDYMKNKGLSLKDVAFVQLEDELNGRLEFWIKETNSDSKGFNR
ncbi:hypothetical protein [Spiroplasma monobiae]|uniref:Uncharacterized protein n=1 Tax=Spiroplasma monobiae MQ-1 TaxID=1336748 RepID=A0A2K9LTS9_SPISQ|nr:hypothetical protein [Spiroplasma monobiae]AUM62410.1 hypothetical protein SMONO_v1c01590 [Spiroplasma monobiae MQ-1]